MVGRAELNAAQEPQKPPNAQGPKARGHWVASEAMIYTRYTQKLWWKKVVEKLSNGRFFDEAKSSFRLWRKVRVFETGQILVKNLWNDKKILDKLKFVKLTIQTSQTDKFWPVFDDPTTRKILCVCMSSQQKNLVYALWREVPKLVHTFWTRKPVILMPLSKVKPFFSQGTVHFCVCILKIRTLFGFRWVGGLREIGCSDFRRKNKYVHLTKGIFIQVFFSPCVYFIFLIWSN